MPAQSPAPTRTVCGHILLQPPGMDGRWVSRAPLERGTTDALVRRMRLANVRYGILMERPIGGRNVGSLTVHAGLDDLRAQMGADKVGKKFGGRDIAINDGQSVLAFEFPAPTDIGVERLRHPLAGVNYAQARGVALAMGLDLPTNAEFSQVLKGDTEGSLFISPDHPDFRKFVHCSIRRSETGVIDVENPRYRDQPHGTRHWLGNVWKWMLRDFAVGQQFASRGGDFHDGNPEIFGALYRDYCNNTPNYSSNSLGLVCVGGPQDSGPFYPWLF